MQRHAGHKGIAKCVPDHAKTSKVPSDNAGAGFHLKRNDRAVVPFDDEIEPLLQPEASPAAAMFSTWPVWAARRARSSGRTAFCWMRASSAASRSRQSLM